MNLQESVRVDALHPFAGNPFAVREDDEFAALVDSIRQFGVITPLEVRPLDNGTFEVVSGHRRLLACQKLGLETVPVLVKELDRDDAVISLVDGNLQREHILPSEKAKAYDMKMAAIAHRGERRDLQENVTSGQVGRKLGQESRAEIGEVTGESARTVQRFIRLNYLEEPLLNMVDAGRVALTPAEQISYLPPEKQEIIAQAIAETDATPSLSQAMRMRQMQEQGKLSPDAVFSVMAEEKGNQKEVLKLPLGRIRHCFPRNMTERQMEETIIKVVEQWARVQQRSQQNQDLER